MKKTLIRSGVFETNSSSSHSISIADETKEFVLDTLYPDDDGIVRLIGGEFGWGWFKHNDALTKANYAAQALHYNDVLIDVIKEQTGAIDVIINVENGYIDHESFGIVPTNKEELRNFIFNKNSWLFGGNDNSGPKPTFYITPEYTHDKVILPDFKYELKIDGYSETTQFLHYPNNDELYDALISILDNVSLHDNDGVYLFEYKGYYTFKNKSNVFTFDYDSKIDFENNEIYFTKDTWNEAYKIYRNSPDNDKEDWSTIGYQKTKEIEKKILKNPEYYRIVKFFINKL